MYWISKGIHQLGRARRRTLIFLAVLGPGIITMVADNDAGGISTYAQTGAKTGFNLLWAFIILVPMAYYVQEMTVRLGAVTKRGHAEAIFDGFGPFWGWFSIFDLALINWLTLVTEYIGMTQAMKLFNIPPLLTCLGVTALLFGIVVSGKYWTFEKITFFFCLFNFVYIPAAIWAMKTGNVSEGWTAVGKGFFAPHFKGGLTAELITLIMANIGTTITPWQIFFQQSAVVDKGMDVRDIKYGKMDTFAGSLVTCIVAAFIIIATAGVFYYHPGGQIVVESAAETAAKMPEVMPNQHWGQWAKVLFSVGLFDAGLLGALCISLSTSWALGEVFGWAHSLNKSVREAPWFYVAYVLMLLSAAVVSLIATVRVQDAITIFVQVVAVTLLPAALFFLILILNDKQVMGEYVNTRWQNTANWGIAIFVVAVSTLYGLSIIFPEWSKEAHSDIMSGQPNNQPKPATVPAGATADFEFYFFSELYKRPVCAGKVKDRIGKVTDLVFKMADPYPDAVGILIDHGWGKPNEFVAWDKVVKIEDDAIFVARREDGTPYPPFVDQPGWILTNEHLMGQTILDIDGRRTEVVNDVHLLESKGRMVLVHVDISFNGFLRKWGLGRLTWIKDKFISWRYVQPLSVEDTQTDTVSLSITRKRIKNLPSEDLADALEELKGDEQQAVFSALDSGKAAEVLIEAEPRAQRQLIANLRQERARTILSEMSVPQLAALFSVLPHDDVTELMTLLPKQQADKIKTIFSQPDATARTFMSADYVAVPKETRVGDLMKNLRAAKHEPHIISYVYVVTPENVLAGVVDLRDLVLAADETTVGELMVFPVVPAQDSNLWDEVADMFEKYHYQILPVVDAQDHLLGVINNKDVVKPLTPRGAPGG